MVRFDLNAAPLTATQGNRVTSWVYRDAGITTVTDTIPEGDFVYFSLFYYAASAWTYLTRHSVFVQDLAVSYPRTAVIFHGWNVFNDDSAQTLARFDMSWMNTNEVLGGADLDPRATHLSLRTYNPNMIPMIHEEAYAIHGTLLEPTNRDTICETMAQIAVSLADQATDTVITVFKDSTQVSVATSTSSWIKLDDASIFPATWNTEPFIHIERGANMEWCRVNQVEDNAGVEQDSIEVERGWYSTANANHAVDTWIYFIDSHGGNTGASGYGWGDIYLDGRDGNKARGLWPWAHKTKSAINILEAYLSSSKLVATGILFDNYYKANSGYDMGATHLTDDSTFIYAASEFISERDSSIYLGFNTTAEGFNGIEKKAQMLNLEEKSFSTQADRWSNERDLYHRMIEGAIIHSYRYGMAQDDYMPSFFCLSNEYDSTSSQRFGDAVAAIFGGFGGTKKRFDKTQCVWADHYSVNTSGNATFPSAVNTEMKWLGWPIQQWQPQEGLYVATELVTNGTFDTDTSSWASSGADSIALSWDSGELKTITNTALHATGHGVTLNELFDEYVESATFAMTNETEYTMKFDVYSNLSKIIGVRLLQNQILYQAEAILSPTTKRTVYLPVYIDTSRAGDSLSAVKIRFGLTPTLQPDADADTLWIDNVSIKKATSDSSGFMGWSREFENGWVGFNFRESAQTFSVATVTDANVTWKRLTCYDEDEVWSDCDVNTGNPVTNTISIPVRDGIFLFKQRPAPPVGGSPAPSGSQSSSNMVLQ
jgi:hypothetical protein